MLVATYNIHKFVGLDFKFRPERILKIISHLNPDILALQEVIISKKAHQSFPLHELAKFLKMKYLFAPTFETEDFLYGHALLTKFQIVKHHIYDISVKNKEKRSLLDVTLNNAGAMIKCYSTHLGLSQGERNAQFEKIFFVINQFLKKNIYHKLILLGDFNQLKYNLTLKDKIKENFLHLNEENTFPSISPFFSLDQIWTNIHHHFNKHKKQVFRVEKSWLARLSSDHLPLLTELNAEGGSSDEIIAESKESLPAMML